MTSVRLRILYATVSGTAALVAESISFDFNSTSVEVINMHDADPGVFDPAEAPLLLCVSTTGSGDVPEDALALLNGLQQTPRYLGGLRYGLITLGDSSYGSTFCGGGQHFDNVLQDLGAARVGEVLQIDATEVADPESYAVAWFQTWKTLAMV